MSINNYFQVSLNPILERESISENIIREINIDIKNRILSLIYYWEDKEYVDTILITGLEEATFYDPQKINEKVKSFVVVTIRNSLIEELNSEDYYFGKDSVKNDFNLDSIMPEITKSAIKYFSKINFKKLQSNITNYNAQHFRNLQEKYPLAWNALFHLSCIQKSKIQEYKFNPIYRKNITIDNLNRGHRTLGIEGGEVVDSGMNPLFDTQLIQILKDIQSNPGTPFFSDSFKGTTRNIEKLFIIIEFCLGINAPFVTFNYYIENGYVSKRKKLLKPFHNSVDINIKLFSVNHDGCMEPKHKESISKVIEDNVFNLK